MGRKNRITAWRTPIAVGGQSNNSFVPILVSILPSGTSRGQIMKSRRRMSWHAFCDAVEEAVESLPEPFHKYLENVVVDVQEEPSEHDYAALSDRGGGSGGLLLGLFIGIPLTKQSYGDHSPNVVKIFRRSMEQASRTRGALLRNIRATVIHEFAHHFGFSEEDLEAFEQAQQQLEDQDR